VLQVAGRPDQSRHFLAAQHDRQPLLHAHLADLGHKLRAIERDLEQELNRRERCIERDGRHARPDQMQLELPQVFGRGCVWRATQKSGQAAHAADVSFLGSVLHLAHAHVFDHALAQRRNSSTGFFAHGPAPVGLTRPIASSPTYETDPQRENIWISATNARRIGALPR
jgi:hypothetical protein